MAYAATVDCPRQRQAHQLLNVAMGLRSADGVAAAAGGAGHCWPPLVAG